MKELFKNNKTTITGAILAIIVAIQPIIETGNLDKGKLAMAAMIAVFGFLTKDYNVTGGTVPQDGGTTPAK